MKNKQLPLQKSIRGYLKVGLVDSSSLFYVIEGRTSQGTSITNINEWLKDYEGMAIKLTAEQAIV